MDFTINYGKIGCAIGVIGVACSLYLFNKIKQVANSVDLTVDELAGKTNIDIDNSMIEAAIQRAVNAELKTIVGTVNRRLIEEIRQSVRASVDMSYSDLKSSVSDEIAKQVKHIDIQAIEREAVTKAKEAIAQKFDNKLDGLLEDFNDNLTNVSKIYASIAKTMSEKA